MKCLRCGFANDSDSKFCEECGNPLERVIAQSRSAKVGQKFQTHTISRQISAVEDVIFKPKPKQVSWGNILGVIALIILGGFFILVWLGSDSSGTTNTTTNTIPQPTSFPISYLNITAPDIKYVNDEAYFIGTLHNKYTGAVKAVYVRLDFYKDKASTQHFDTRTVDVGGTISNGAFSFQVPLTIYPSGQFWWNWQVIEAEGY